MQAIKQSRAWFDELSHMWLHAVMVGSRVTCDPPPDDTDEDWLILCSIRHCHALLTHLNEDDWDLSISLNGDDDHEQRRQFWSVGKTIDGQDINLIITFDEVFHAKFWAATTIAKHLNLLEKQDRIDLFQAVLYGRPKTQLPGVPYANH